MSNFIVIANMGQEHPSEIVKFTFDLTSYTAFTGSSAETLTASASWKVVSTSATSVDLASSMVNATDYDNTAKTVSVEIKSGTTGTSYYVVGLITTSSGRKYFVGGKLAFTDKGISIRWS